jgi:hypothetical protein
VSDQAAGDNNFEDIIRRALAPVEPPDDLGNRLEMTLWSLTEMAVDELESWELSSMRDPRNWARPVAAIAIGTAAGAGLILLGWRHQHRRQRTVRGAAVEVRRIVRR